MSFIEPLESRIAPAGLVTAIYDPATRELTVTGDDASNVVVIYQTGPATWRVEGREDAVLINTSINTVGDERMEIGPISKLSVSLAGGNDQLDLVNLRALKQLTVSTGSGADSVETSGLVVKGNAFFDTGAGADSVDLDGLIATITGNLTATDSADGLALNFGAARSTVNGSVAVTGSAAADVLTMSTDTALTIGKNITFTGNGGLDSLSFGSQGIVSVGRDAQGRSIIYEGGAVNDRLSIGSHRVTLLGSVEMNGNNGNDTLDIDGVTVSIGRSLAGASVFLNGGQGSDQIDIQGTSITTAGLIQLDGGLDNDLLDLTRIHKLTLGRGILMDGASGADTFSLSADSLTAVGNIQINGGDDADIASLIADGTIRGNVAFALGAALAGTQTGEIRARSGLPGGLKISGSVTFDTSAASANTIDNAKLTNLVIGGLLDIKMADGSSFVDMDNLTVSGNVQLDTRAGNDDVQIERDANFGISIFKKLTTILLGNGTDTLLIGKDSKNNRIQFLGNVTLDGGDGSDTRNDTETENKFAPTATFSDTAFEIVLPPVV